MTEVFSQIKLQVLAENLVPIPKKEMDGSSTNDANSISLPDYSTPLLSSTPNTTAASSSPDAYKAPEDKFHACYIIFFVLGFGYVLPWNAFITAVDYFSYIYPDTSVDGIFSIVNMLVELVSLLVITFFFDRRVDVFVRINIGLSMYTLALVLMPIMEFVYIKGQVGLYNGFYVSVGAISVSAMGGSLVQSGMIGSAGELPEKYMQAVVAGNGASGIIVSMLRILTKALYPREKDGLRSSANIYFTVGVGVILLCIVLYNVVQKLPVVKYYKELQWQVVEEDIQEHNPSLGTEWGSTLSYIVRKIKWHGLCLILLNIVTLSIFPGYITEDVHSKALEDWYPVLLITGYNVYDFVGRWLTALCLLKNIKAVICCCTARVLFLPLFLGCFSGPPIFSKEIVVSTLTCLLGLTNGYLTCVVMISAPKLVPAQHKRIAGTVMVLFLVLGMALGSILSRVWKF